MKKISIQSNPEYDSPNNFFCKAIIENIINLNKIRVYDITVIFTSDIFVSDLKKKFFLKDQWTDVIAFPMNDNENGIEGDIYISLPTAKENAEKYEEPYKKEVTRLVIHGVLHLLGYDDKTKKEKKIMSNLEEYYLNEENWENLFEKE